MNTLPIECCIMHIGSADNIVDIFTWAIGLPPRSLPTLCPYSFHVSTIQYHTTIIHVYHHFLVSRSVRMGCQWPGSDHFLIRCRVYRTTAFIRHPCRFRSSSPATTFHEIAK